MWASVYSSLEESERKFRHAQLLRVLHKLKMVEQSSRPNAELLSIIIGAVLNCAPVERAKDLYTVYLNLFDVDEEKEKGTPALMAIKKRMAAYENNYSLANMTEQSLTE